MAAQPLWFDEVVLVTFAGLTTSDWLANLWASQSPAAFMVKAPLIILGMRTGVPLFGDTEAAHRAPFVVVGILTIPIFFYLSRRLLGPLGAVIATTLVVVSPFHVYYSQQVSEYGPLLLFGLLSMLLWVPLMERSDGERWKAAAVPTLNLLGLAIHPLHAMVGTIQLVEQIRRRGAGRRRLLAAQALILVGALGVGATMALDKKYLTHAVSWIPDLSAGFAVDTLRQFSHGVMTHGALGVDEPGLALTALMICTLVLALIGALALGRERVGNPGMRWVICGWIGIPVASAIVISLIIQSIAVPRYFIFLFPALILLTAAGCLELFRWSLLAWLATLHQYATAGLTALLRWRPLTGLAVMAALLALLVVAHRQQHELVGPSTRELAVYLNDNLQDGDGILLSPDYLRWEMGYYLGWEEDDAWLNRKSKEDSVWTCIDGRRPPTAKERAKIMRWIASKKRIWFTRVTDWPGDKATPRLTAYMEANFEKTWTNSYDHSGAELSLYVPKRTK